MGEKASGMVLGTVPELKQHSDEGHAQTPGPLNSITQLSPPLIAEGCPAAVTALNMFCKTLP